VGRELRGALEAIYGPTRADVKQTLDSIEAKVNEIIASDPYAAVHGD